MSSPDIAAPIIMMVVSVTLVWGGLFYIIIWIRSFSIFQKALLELGFLVLGFGCLGALLAAFEAIEGRDWQASLRTLPRFAVVFSAIFLLGVMSNVVFEWAVVKRILKLKRIAEEARNGGDSEKVALLEKKIRRLRKGILGKVKELGE